MTTLIPDPMRITLTLACLFLVTSARAQLPVFDAAVVAKAVATIAELKQQVRLLTEDLAVTKEIRTTTTDHFMRFQRTLTKRGVVESLPLGRIAEEVEAALSGALSYMEPQELDDIFVLYAMPRDPLAYDREVTTRSMNTVAHTMQALTVHGENLRRTHQELERFKREIAQSPEPQQMMDVQASLQVLAAREALLTRQALMTLTNMEAIRAAHELNEKAQRRAIYNTFVGQTNWLGDPSQYDARSFLRMPGE